MRIVASAMDGFGATESARPTGAGAASAMVGTFDWAATPLGPIGAWPQSLRTAVDLVMAMREPAYVAWGDELVLL